MLYYIHLTLLILAVALGQVFYKKYYQTKNVLFYFIAIALFIATPYFNYKALKGLSIDIVSIYSALTIIVVYLFSIFLFKEKQDKMSIMGLISIVVGLIIYAI